MINYIECMWNESVILLAKLQSFGTPIISIVLQIPAQTTKKNRNKKINDENSNEAIVAIGETFNM